MADTVSVNIKPGGLSQKFEVDLWYQLFESLNGICLKLDSDGGVPLTTYTANIITAIANGKIENSKGGSQLYFLAEENHLSITPRGITNAARLQAIYQFFNMLETLTEQLDTDVLTDSTYEALCYTAIMTQMVEDPKGNILGNLDTDTGFYFKPGGTMNEKQLVQFFYNAVLAIETLTEQLDADGTVTDITYESLWFTAIILTRVEDGKGNVVGNTYPQN